MLDEAQVGRRSSVQVVGGHSLAIVGAKCSSEFRAIHGERYSSQDVAMFPAGHAAASYDDIVAGSWSGGRHAAEMTLKRDGDEEETDNGNVERREQRLARLRSVSFPSKRPQHLRLRQLRQMSVRRL